MKSPSERILFNKYPNDEKGGKDSNSPEDYTTGGQSCIGQCINRLTCLLNVLFL